MVSPILTTAPGVSQLCVRKTSAQVNLDFTLEKNFRKSQYKAEMNFIGRHLNIDFKHGSYQTASRRKNKVLTERGVGISRHGLTSWLYNGIVGEVFEPSNTSVCLVIRKDPVLFPVLEAAWPIIFL